MPTPPAANSSSAASAACTGRVVATPPISHRASAPRSRSRASPRLAPLTTSLASRLSYRGGTAEPAWMCVSTRMPGPAGKTALVTRPGLGLNPAAGSSALIRHSIAWPSSRTPAWDSLSRRPSATAICSATRSIPVTASVTGCSTWMRAFTSRNQNSDRPASTRNSTVPRPWYFRCWPNATAAARIPTRSVSPSRGAGASSISFW